MLKSLRIGILGFGEIGQAHASALSEIAEANLVAVADPDGAALHEASKLGVQTFDNHQALLDLGDVDAVIVATPDDSHVSPCLAAIASGRHVLVEKPIALTVEDGKRIGSAAQACGVKVMVGHTLRFFPEYQYARSRIEAGMLGDLISVFARRTNLITQSARIRGRVSVLGFLGVHDFDVLRWMIGSEPVRVFCENATSVTHGYGVEDETFTTIRFASGVVACVHCGWFVPENHPSGFDFRLDVTGNKGLVNLDFSRSVSILHDREGTHAPLHNSALVNESRAFVRAVLDDTPVPVSADDGIAAVRMVRAAETSARTGRPVDLVQ